MEAALIGTCRFALKHSLRCCRTFHSSPSLCNLHSTAPQVFKVRLVPRSSPPPCLLSSMPTFRTITPDPIYITDSTMKDATPMIKFEDEIIYDGSAHHNDSMIFGPLEGFDDQQQFSPDMIPWDSFEDLNAHTISSTCPSPLRLQISSISIKPQSSNNALYQHRQIFLGCKTCNQR
jgi:hypothetical protein